MHTTEPNELGCANTALVLALCQVLAGKGVLTRQDFDELVTVAISELEAMGDGAPRTRTIELIESLLPKIRENSIRQDDL